MQIPGTASQIARHPIFDASGTSTGSAQLVLPEAKARSLLYLQNISDTVMYVEMGSARATATLTSGAVTGFTITNAGFNFTIPPIVTLLGGGNPGNSTFLGAGLPLYDSPTNVATATAVLTAGAVSSLVVSNPGSLYKTAPYVFISNSPNDPSGCAVPSAGVGFYLAASGGSITIDGTACPTDPVALFCASSGKAFVCKFMN